MKKTITLLIIAFVMAILIPEKAFAQPGTFFPNYFINQTFDGVEAMPSGWSFGSGNSAYMGRAGSSASFGSPAQGFVRISGSGSGARGGELRFPSTATSQFKDSTVWVIEFDWTANAVGMNGMSGATACTLLGPNSVNLAVNSTFWAAAIFEFYAYNANGFMHLTNLDPIGKGYVLGAPFNPDALSTPVGYCSDGNNSWFGRRSTTSATIADSLNMTTRTKIVFGVAKKYHVFAELNFATQMVKKFAMYEKENPTNGDTIYNKPFIAPWVVGTAPIVAFEDRKVTQFDRLSTWATRPGSGNAVADHSYDNLQAYVWKASVGIADVSVKYVDRAGNPVKDNRVMTGQQVNSTVWLAATDKANFTSNDGMYYYFYDEEATHLANAAKGADGESLTVGAAGADNSLTVVFKKVAVTTGSYVWSGETSGKWNYLDDNFKVSGGSPMSYQPGNEASFSNPDALYKTVEVTGEVDLKDANMTVSAPDYVFGGTGRIIGNGTLMVSAPTTLGSDNRMSAGAIIQTSQPVLIKHANAAAKFKTTEPEITLGLEAGATFTKAIEGMEGSTLNLNLVSLNEYAPAISGFSTVNIHQTTQTSLNSATWRTGWGGTMPANAQVNYYNDVVGNLVPNGLGIVSAVMQNAKLHLGPHTRLVRQYNENSNNNDVVYIGALTGDAGSRIESGFVDGRYFRYDIGGLGTDAVFNGEIGAFTRSHVAATDTTAEVATYAANGVGITKSGAGTWTVNGNFNFPTGTRGSQVNVSGGKFIINGNILFPNYTKEGSQINVTGEGLLDVNGKIKFVTDSAAHVIKVTTGTLQLHDSIIAPAINQIVLTVDATGTLKTGNNFIGASTVTVNGIVEGGGKYANAFSMTNELSVLKLKVNNFEPGNFEYVDALGDISIKKGIIDITVLNSPIGSKQITILKAGGNYDILDNMAFVQVLVNGKNITGNTPQTEVPEGGEIYYFDPETGILGHLGVSGINDVNASKEIKHVEYFNMLGQKVTKYHLGYTLKRTTYTDNSVETIKFFNQERLIELNDQK
jgi:hypothetical protein